MLILFNGKLRASRGLLVTACLLVVLGGLAQMYVTIIGGQAYPLDIFPGWEERSSFFDGVVHPYHPSLPEFLLGLGGVAVALAIVTIGVKVLRFLPESLADADVDPHAAG
jgi:Ni/Fe-hydrogenase subunit HybB-like protein